MVYKMITGKIEFLVYFVLFISDINPIPIQFTFQLTNLHTILQKLFYL